MIDSLSTTTVRGMIDFAPGQRPPTPFTVTVLVEDVSKADAPSTIVGRSRFEIPASAPVDSACAARPDTGVPFHVAVPTSLIAAPRRLNVRVHVRSGVTAHTADTENVRREPDSREPMAHPEAREPSRATHELEFERPDITEGDFVSTQSHSVLPGQGRASVRIPVLRV
ncbi:hypothetical protein E3O25_13720 [Cryobacterium sp. TMT1-3]|uniref:Uncharacterized protein n=1 Tax=Cryobacterium luteum TaxID=1424661 RepID=A0A1H8K8S0_9MICO|nr:MULTISPECIES: YbaY family lipoprotein [Cryobacterium]TFB92382.1 hypothetical protein E3O10_04905 [Cryobacterium luteum]TFC25062.1 hypothetical protein E3O25_13720 [Cryobacterium sp. TMT1-3]SEN89412.1 Type III secretion system lipoprotein chaperone (YscW) [Cryobacterium luteum]